jgi:hypothetical protein
MRYGGAAAAVEMNTTTHSSTAAIAMDRMSDVTFIFRKLLFTANEF